MAQSTNQPLYLITDGGQLRSEGKLLLAIEKVLAVGNGSVGFVQLREQSDQTFPATDREILQLIHYLQPICQQHQAKLMLNRRVDLAVASKCDGVHLGAHSISITEGKRLVPQHTIIGYSAHSIEEIHTVHTHGAQYILFSPIFPPRWKQTQTPSLGLDVLRQAAMSTSQLLYALGGINPSNVLGCKKAGASGIACLSAILHQKHPEQACLALLHAWQSNEAF